MSNREVIENKISTTRGYLMLARQYQKHTQEEIEHNPTIRGAVERYLYLAAQSAIDLAEASVAFKGLRKPTTMSESFHILLEAGLISEELVGKMVQMTGFRNVMAHEYTAVNYGVVYHILQNGLQDIEELLAAIESGLN